ncbi:hypothetical protein PFISCL1PPCAC_22673, partial [Pristionchus fissidentatus]
TTPVYEPQTGDYNTPSYEDSERYYATPEVYPYDPFASTEDSIIEHETTPFYESQTEDADYNTRIYEDSERYDVTTEAYPYDYFASTEPSEEYEATTNYDYEGCFYHHNLFISHTL